MSGTEWLVVVGGIAAIAWVNWYFFLAQRAAPPAAAPATRGTPGEAVEH